jgi:sugar (pentulose or hexulose) kinase
MSRPRVVDLGVDLGTTVTKLVALDEDGSPVGDASVATVWEEPAEGYAERDPRAVVDAVEELVGRATDHLAGGGDVRIRSIGFTSMAEAGVLVDAGGEARSRVMAWFDARGDAQAAALDPDVAREFPARTGLAVSHVPTLFKVAWLRDQGLDLRGLQWLSLPELVVHRLGGRRVAERSLLGRTGFLDVHTGGPHVPALRHLGADEGLVPEIVGAGTPAGRVRADHPVAAARGAVLTVAGHDHAVAAAASGSATTASAMDSIDTAEAILVASPRVPAPAVVARLSAQGVAVYPHVVRGTTGLLGAVRTGLVLKRVLHLLGTDDEDGRARVDRESMAHRGERLDVEVTGLSMRDHDVVLTLHGDSPTPGRLWRAALDRSTEHAAEVLAHLADAGIRIDRLVLAGGWTGMPSVVDARRSLAPVVEVAASQQPGPRGAALFGRWAALHADPGSTDQRPPADYFAPFLDPPALVEERRPAR